MIKLLLFVIVIILLFVLIRIIIKSIVETGQPFSEYKYKPLSPKVQFSIISVELIISLDKYQNLCSLLMT